MSDLLLDPPKETILWIGGTSSLARTFFANYGDVVHVVERHNETTRFQERKWILTGLETEAPWWIQHAAHINDISIDYMSLDLTNLTVKSAQRFLLKDTTSRYPVTNMIIGVRPLLFDKYIFTDQTDYMLKGLKIFLEQAVVQLSSLDYILHISSVAAADHLREQCNAEEQDPLPPLSEYHAPYDRFKRGSEDVITKICQGDGDENTKQISCCHLRLSAIFSDDRSCIQCSALDLQARVGCYLPLAIDCNSSLNVAKAINLLLNEAAIGRGSPDHALQRPLSQVFYYTRPLDLKEPSLQNS
ncbi:MAG: hypothetical protein SGARI_000644 [Bacillariaceae sp.]